MSFFQLLHEAFAAGNDGIFVQFGVGAIIVRLGLLHVDCIADVASLVNITAVIHQDL